MTEKKHMSSFFSEYQKILNSSTDDHDMDILTRYLSLLTKIHRDGKDELIIPIKLHDMIERLMEHAIELSEEPVK